MEASLTVLYTAHLRGSLELLPRLYSFIRQLKAHYSEEAVVLCPDDPAPANPIGRILLLDLGDSCAPDVWHCGITGGRSMLVALDSMGYDAANVSGLSPQDRAKLDGIVRMGLVDVEHDHVSDDVVVSLRHDVNVSAQGIRIQSMSAESSTLDGQTLRLASVDAGQIGVARVCKKKLPYELEVIEVFDLPRQTQPDPTIAGMVDFVTSEARQAQKRQAR